MIDFQRLPPDAIASVVNAYRDAYENREAVAGGVWEHQANHAAGCAAFRDALAAVLPKEAAPDDPLAKYATAPEWLDDARQAMQALYGAAAGHPNGALIERNVTRINEALKRAPRAPQDARLTGEPPNVYFALNRILGCAMAKRALLESPPLDVLGAMASALRAFRAIEREATVARDEIQSGLGAPQDAPPGPQKAALAVLRAEWSDDTTLDDIHIDLAQGWPRWGAVSAPDGKEPL